MPKSKYTPSGTSAVLYVRVSSEEQVTNFSLSTQEEICKKEAEKRGLTIDQIFREEGRSAKTISGRPQLIEMMSYCRSHKRCKCGDCVSDRSYFSRSCRLS
jgi:DNA invertase Pin-like site-specific DNA recombinase